VLADRSRWPVRLRDQSAGGFAVLTDCPAAVSRGDIVQLHTDSFCEEVRVVYTTEIEPGDKLAHTDGARLTFCAYRRGQTYVLYFAWQSTKRKLDPGRGVDPTPGVDPVADPGGA